MGELNLNLKGWEFKSSLGYTRKEACKIKMGIRLWLQISGGGGEVLSFPPMVRSEKKKFGLAKSALSTSSMGVVEISGMESETPCTKQKQTCSWLLQHPFGSSLVGSSPVDLLLWLSSS